MSNLLSRRRLLRPVSTKYGDFALLACCYVAGLLDATAYANWGVFVGMQTGNTVLLCLASTGFPDSQPYVLASTAVSLASFLLGAFVTTRVCHGLGKLRRSTLASNFLLQGLLVGLAALLALWRLVPVSEVPDSLGSVRGHVWILAVLPPLAFQSGATIVTSRLLSYNELPVNVVTSTYADLAGDLNLFAGGNTKRTRRAAAVLLMAMGALSAAWMMKRGPGTVWVLFLAAGIKIAVALAVALFMEQQDEEDGNCETGAETDRLLPATNE